MRLFLVSLVAAVVLVTDRQAPAGRLDDPAREGAFLQPKVHSAREALAWLGRHSVTLTEFIAVTGMRPTADGGQRWQFADGTIVTSGIQLANGEILITCWGRAK
jgi:hypothetical protein